MEKVDCDKDGLLSETELHNTRKIVVNWDNRGFVYNPVDCQGIEFFTELEELQIYGVQWADKDEEEMCDIGVDISLDVSKNTIVFIKFDAGAGFEPEHEPAGSESGT